MGGNELKNNFVVKEAGWSPYYVALNRFEKRDLGLTNLFQYEMEKHGEIIRNIAICFSHTEK